MKRISHWIILWLILGEQYFVLEAIYRFIFKQGERAHIAMLAIGGLCLISIGAINQIPRFYKSPMLLQAIIGAIITLLIEFISGYILNILLGLAIWDYTGLSGNIMGQICLPFAGVWFFLMPFAIWIEDFARYKLYYEGEYYALWQNYKELFRQLIYILSFGHVKYKKEID